MVGTADNTVAVFTDGGEAWVVSPDSGVATLVDSLSEPPANIDTSPVFPSDRDSLCHDSAIIGDTIMYVWHYRNAYDDAAFTDVDSFRGTYYMLRSLSSGAVLKPPTRLSAGDYCTVNTMSTSVSDEDEIFVVASSYEPTSPWRGFDAHERQINIFAVSSTGVTLDSSTVVTDALLWDYCGEGPGTGGNQYHFMAWVGSNGSANLNAAADLTAHVRSIAYSFNSFVVTDGAFPVPGSTLYEASDLICVQYMVDTDEVFVGWLNTAADGITWTTADVLLSRNSSDFTSGWSAPTTMFSITNPDDNLTTATYLDAERVLIPHNVPYMGTHIPYPGTGYESRFYRSQFRGAFVKVNASNDIMFLVSGISPRMNKIIPSIELYQPFVGGAEWCGIKMCLLDSSGTVISSQAEEFIEPNVTMVSKPWWDGEQAHVIVSASPPIIWGAHPDGSNIAYIPPTLLVYHAEYYGGRSNQSAYMVAQIPSDDASTYLKPEAVFMVDEALSGKQFPTLWNGSSVTTLDDGVHVALPVRGRSSLQAAEYVDGATLEARLGALFSSTGSSATIRLSAGHSLDRLPAALVDDTVLVGTGSMAYFDGVNMRGATLVPMAPTLLFSDSGGSSDIRNDDYAVGTTFRVTDAKGNIHRSGEAYDTGVAARSDFFKNDPPVVRYPHPPLSLFKAQQRSADTAYRVGLNNKVYSTQTSNIGEMTKEVLGAYDGPFFTSDDEITDGSSSGGAMASTGELQPEITNGALFVAVRRNRVFFIDENKPTQIRYSKLIGATTTVEFNQNLQVRIPEATGGAVALGVMDDKIIVFAKDKTYYFAGEGPNNLGEGAFTDPRPIASSHGCINPASVISTARGVFFQSRRGMMLLDRNLVTHYIGDRVERTMSTASIVSVVEDPISNEVRWFFDDGSGSHGSSSLVYNQDSDAWSIWTGLSIDAGLSSSVTPITSTFHEGAEYLLFSDGSISKQARDVKDLASGSLYIGTPWLSAGGRLDMMRVREMHALFELPTSFGANESFRLAVQVYYNYLDGSGPAQVARSYDVPQENIAYGTVPSGFADEAVQTASIRLPLDIQKCSSFRVRLQFSTSGSGYTTPDTDILLTNLGFVVASKPAGNKVPNNQSN